MNYPKHILVRSPNWIGDQVLAFPFFYYLRKKYPDSRITVACVPWVKDLQYQTLVDDIFVMLPSPSRSIWSRMGRVNAEAKRLRALGPFDLGISLPNSFSSAWLLKFAGAKRRIGYSTEGRGLLLNQRVKWVSDSSRHRAQAYVDLLPQEARPSSSVKDFWGAESEGALAVLKRFEVELYWKPDPVFSSPRSEYFIVAPGATADSRRWDIENFKKFVRLVHREKGWSAVVVGGPKEIDLGDALAQEEDVVDLTGKCRVPELAPLFQNAQFTVCNESGLAHVAALCGSPVQIVCGAADPRRTCPLGPGKVQVKVNPVECWPCERNVCLQTGSKKVQCLRGIHVDGIWKDIQNGLLGDSSQEGFERNY